MDADLFDRLIASLAHRLTRRRSLGLLSALGAGAGIGMQDAGARKKKKKKKKKKTCNPECSVCQTCNQGKCTPKPGGTDCGSGNVCTSGVCGCPNGQRSCGGRCSECCATSDCPGSSGQICENGQCVPPHGICNASTNYCAGDTAPCGSDSRTMTSPTCFCYKTTQNESACALAIPGFNGTPFLGVACTTDAECTAAFGTPAVCAVVDGCLFQSGKRCLIVCNGISGG